MLDYVVVNDRERAHIALLVQRCRRLAEAQLDENIQALYANQSATGELQSGSTITYAVNTMSDVVAHLIPELASRVAAIVCDTAAFEEVKVATGGILDAFHERLAGVVRVAEGRRSGQDSDRGVLNAAEKIFQDWRTDVELQLAILAYDFTPPVGPGLDVETATPAHEPRPSSPPADNSPRLSDAALGRWWAALGAQRDAMSLVQLLESVRADHPGHNISRERIRALAGGRVPGRKPFGGNRPAD